MNRDCRLRCAPAIEMPNVFRGGGEAIAGQEIDYSVSLAEC